MCQQKQTENTHVTLSMPCDIKSLDGHFTSLSITNGYDGTSRNFK